MPVYCTRAEVKKLVRFSRCAVCQGKLIAFLDAETKQPFVACADWLRTGHLGITSHNLEYEKYMKERKEMYKMDTKALMVMTETHMMARINMAKFPQELTIPEKKLLAQIAITYGFDPLMGEVTIYQGRPFVSIDGRYRKAQETNRLDGVESRPATKQERIDWQIPDGDYFFCAAVSVKGASKPFVGWGRVHNAETVGGKGFKPVEKNPQRMAEKRAEAQALRKAFHIPLPSAEDIGSPDNEVIGNINVKTGEITVEGECKEIPTETAQPVAEQPKAPESTTATKAEPQTLAEKAFDGLQSAGSNKAPADLGKLYLWIMANVKDKKVNAKQYALSCGVSEEDLLHNVAKAYEEIKRQNPDWKAL